MPVAGVVGGLAVGMQRGVPLRRLEPLLVIREARLHGRPPLVLLLTPDELVAVIAAVIPESAILEVVVMVGDEVGIDSRVTHLSRERNVKGLQRPPAPVKEIEAARVHLSAGRDAGQASGIVVVEAAAARRQTVEVRRGHRAAIRADRMPVERVEEDEDAAHGSSSVHQARQTRGKDRKGADEDQHDDRRDEPGQDRDRKLLVGDVIEIDGKVGRVVDIKLRTTRALTRDDKVIIIPNHKFIKDTVYNYTQNHKQTRDIVKVGVAYGSDTRLVEKLLLESLVDLPGVLQTPAPFVVFDDFGDSSLNFTVYFSISDSFIDPRIKSAIRFRIDALFREHNITIPFPQRDVHMYKTL